MAVYIQSGGNPVPAAQAVAPASGIDAFGRGLQTGNQFVSEFVNREEQLDDIERKRRAEQLMLEDRAAEAYQSMIAGQQPSQAGQVTSGGGGTAAAPGGAFISPEVQAGLNMQAAASQIAESDAQQYASAVAAQDAERRAARVGGQRLESFEEDRALVNALFADGVLSAEEMVTLESVAPQLAGQVNVGAVEPGLGRSMDPWSAAGEVGRLQAAADDYFGGMEQQETVAFEEISRPAGNPLTEIGEPATFLPSPGKLVDFLRTSSKPELANMSPASREAFLQRYRQHYDKVQTKLKGMVLEAQQNALTERVDRVESMLIQQNSQFTRKRQMAPDALRSLAEAAVKGDDAMVKSLLSSVDANSRADLNRSVQWAQVNLAKRKYEEPREARRAASNAVNEVERLEEDLTAAISSGNSQDEAAIRAALQDAEVQREDAFAALDEHDPGSSEKYRKARQEERELEDQRQAIENRELAIDSAEKSQRDAIEATRKLQDYRKEVERLNKVDAATYGATSAQYVQNFVNRLDELEQLEEIERQAKLTADRAESAARQADTNLNVVNRKSTRTIQSMKDVEAAQENAALNRRKLLAGVELTEAEVRKLKAEASGGGSTGDIKPSQYYSAQSRVIKMLGPQNRAEEFARLLGRSEAATTKLEEASVFLASNIAKKNPGTAEWNRATTKKETAAAELARIDAAIADLVQEQSRSIADRIADTPGLRAAMIDLNNDARSLGRQTPFPTVGFGTAESPPPSVTETTTVTVTEDDPTGSFSAPPVTPAIQSVLEKWDAQWDGNAYVLSNGRRMTPDRLKRLEADGKL